MRQVYHQLYAGDSNRQGVNEIPGFSLIPLQYWKGKKMEKTDIRKVEQRLVISETGLRRNFHKYVKRVTGQQSFFSFLYQELTFALFAGLPTVLGSVLRAGIYRSLLGKIGSNCFIEEGVRFRIPKKIFLGNRVFIGKNCDRDVEYPDS